VEDWKRMMDAAIAAEVAARMAAARAGVTDEQWTELYRTRYAQFVAEMVAAV
jgi:hypothetical protein